MLFYDPFAAQAKPNVVLVMADDQGWGDMAYQGHALVRTPNFDEMAKEAIRFNRFYAAAPVCSPTRGSVLTGRHPNRFGCFKWGHTLRPQELTLAEVLRANGYRTGHFGKWHLGSVRKGSPVNPGASGFDTWFSAENFFDNDAILSREGRAVQTTGESSMVTVDAALDFIEDCGEKDQPFLAVVWFGSPHNPHRALEKDAALYSEQTEELKHFLGEITAMDRAFGKLRSQIKDLGMDSNTLLWYCSDNGALPKVGSTGGFRGNKGQVYEGGLLVPSILEWTGRWKGERVVLDRCNTSDIFPTILELAGISRDDKRPIDGVSLVPLLNGIEWKRPRPMGFWDYPEAGISTPSHVWMKELLDAQSRGIEPDNQDRLRSDAGRISKSHPKDVYPGHSAWIDGDWKLHRIADKQGRNIKYELYHLGNDPHEKTDIALLGGARLESMKSDLARWLGSVVSSLNGEDY